MATTERKIPIDPRSTVLGPRPLHRSTRPIPYDTGKVKIGSRYEPVFHWTPSADMYLLQSALLEARPSYWEGCVARFRNLLKVVGS